MARIVCLDPRRVAYVGSFCDALAALGIDVVDGDFSAGWLRRNLRPGDTVHLQWPSFLYATRRTRAGLVHGFARFAVLLLLIRLCGARIVWTAHNLMPHEPCRMPALDVMARHLVIRMSSRIFVHGPSAAALLTARFPAARRKIVLISHGNWIDRYPNIVTQEDARTSLALSADARVFLFVGACKPYKNLEGLIGAFAVLDGEAELIIAGRFHDPAYEDLIQALAAPHARIRILSGFVPEDELQTLMSACDAVVAPYRDILTSGTAMLAASFGRPIVSLDKDFLRDVVTPRTGIVFDDSRQGAFTEALRKVSRRTYDRAEIIAHARRYRFADAARTVAAEL